MDYELNITVELRDLKQGYGNCLRVAEQIKVTATGFMEVCAILASFHELAEKVKK